MICTFTIVGRALRERGPLVLCAWILLATLAAGAGCTSPRVMEHPATRVLAAVPGLTYVNGDPEAGTTTLVSAPLMTYRATRERAGGSASETFVLPLLARFKSSTRRVEPVWADAPLDPPRDGWWDRRDDGLAPRGRRPPPERAPAPRRAERGAPERDASAGAAGGPGRAGAAAPRAGEPARTRLPGPIPSKGGATAAERSRTERSRAEDAAGGLEPVRLRLSEPGEILWTRPQEETEIDILFPLLRIHASRPGQVAVRSRAGPHAVYEVGPPARDEHRLLPLFSFRREGEAASFVFWPLLVGYEREADGAAYLRLFYFLKIPLG